MFHDERVRPMAPLTPPYPLREEGKGEGLKKIRFAIGLRDFSKKRGGAERYLVDLCARMASEGHEVHVYAERQDVEDPGILFHSVKTIPFPKSIRLLSFAIRATEAMENGNYDITFGVGNTLKADILQPHGGVHWAWFWRSLRVYDQPLVWVIKFLGRVLSPKQWVQGYIESSPYKKKHFRKIIAISDMVKQDMMRWYRIPEEKISVVYNGVDIERFRPRNRQYREEIRGRHGIGTEEMVILFVSNNFRMKGLVFLIKALARIKEGAPPPIKLLILGRDRQGSYLGLARSMGIFEDVIFAGSTNEPEKYYGASDLLVHPTFYDACSLTVLEALASGIPVITTRCNGASGIVTQGQEGFVIYDPRDDRALAEKISFFLNREKLERASIAARHLAESYSLERNWREMEHILLDDLPKGGPSE
ncbi:MAG TPA: glycosyltransferase family 4 protein [Thermodesulfobacteriota bacterium]|nr:glycosyltransferase family 4 protein [Thermodesulfobacteriota bacterium]